MKELSETRQPHSTELKKLDPLPRYCARKVEKMTVFQIFSKHQTRVNLKSGPKNSKTDLERTS